MRSMPPAELVRTLRERLAEEPDVLVAYLYGSHARRTAGPLSDVDVAVLLREDADRLSRRLDLIATVAEATGQDAADVVLLNEAPVALGYRVLRDGVLLVSHDERARVRYAARTVDRYLDMAPMRRMYAEGTRHRLAEGRFGRP
jgi:uncharacterized protein